MRQRSTEHILVLAPAGSGKTTFLLDRFIELVRGGADPAGILMLVHNRKAARAGQDRILRVLATSQKEICVATWHAFALGLLSRHFAHLGYRREPALLTAPEQFALVREMLQAPEEQEHWRDRAKMLRLRGFAEALRELVLRAQDANLLPEEIEARAVAAGDRDLEEAARFFRRYLTLIDDQDVVDHANAITGAIAILRQRPDVPRPEHVLVDDYHDVSLAQRDLLRELSEGAATVCVAGDPDSHIFGFRGTSLGPLEAFDQDFAPAEVRRLEGSRRGAPRIEAWRFEHLAEEAQAVARECLRLNLQEGVPWGEIAVIVRRYGAASRAIQRALSRQGVPHVVVGENRSLAHEPALRPMLDLARAALRVAERDDLLPAILSSPVGGLDPYEVRALRREARIRDVSLQTLVTAPPPELPERLRERLNEVRVLLDEVAERNAGEPADAVFWFLWERLDYLRAFVERGDHEALDACEAFADAITRFAERRPGARFAGYLDVLDAAEFGPEPWILPEERRPDAVRLMTAHHAAGLEFEATIVAGCVEGEFPDLREARPLFELDDAGAAEAPAARRARALAAERRIFSVATSRARRRLVLTASRRSGAGEALTPSPLLLRLGIDWDSAPAAGEAITPDEAVTPEEAITPDEIEAAARRRLADRTLSDAERLAALEVLARLPGVEPERWWYEREWTDPGVPIAPQPLRTSYSRLSVYENCPLQYLYQVELGLDPTESHQMLVGSWVHDIVDRCARKEIEATEEALIRALDERWDPSLFPSPAVEHRRRLDSEEMLRRWLKVDGGLPTLASEVDFSFPIDGAIMRGKIDRIVRMGGRSVRLIDYKTSRYSKSQEQVDDDLQLASYFLALKRDPELKGHGEPRYLELAFLGDFYKGAFMRRGIDVSKRPDFEERAEARLLVFVDGITREAFAPSPDADCQWCRFKNLCPVWPEGDEVRL